MSLQIELPDRTIECIYQLGEADGFFLSEDINDGITFMENEGDTPKKILATPDAVADLRTDEEFLQEQDLMLADNEINVVTKLWWFRREKENPAGVIFDLPVFSCNFAIGKSNAILIGEEDNLLVKG